MVLALTWVLHGPWAGRGRSTRHSWHPANLCQTSKKSASCPQNDSLKSPSQKDNFKETCEINLSSLLNVSISADLQAHGARPRDSDNILTDGASLQLCGKLEVWGLWHIMTEERSHECLVRPVNFWSRRIPPLLPPSHSGIIKTTNSLENILLMTQYRPCYDRAKIILYFGSQLKVSTLSKNQAQFIN